MFHSKNRVHKVLVFVLMLGAIVTVSTNASGSATTANQLQKRVFIVETLAVLVANRMDTVDPFQSDSSAFIPLLQHVVEGELGAVSAAVRMTNGTIISAIGNHQENWTLKPADKSKPTQLHVPLFNGSNKIASVEVRFQPLSNEPKGPTTPFYAKVLAVHIKAGLTDQETQELLQNTVVRSRYVSSAALRASDGSLKAVVGNHQENWTLTPQDESTYAQLQEVIHDDLQRITTVEVIVNMRKKIATSILGSLLGLD